MLTPKRKRLIERLVDLPWWVALLVAALVFAGTTFVVPAFAPASKAPVAEGLSSTGWILSIPFLLIAVATAVRQWFQRRLVDEQRNLDSIRQLPRHEPEHLIGEAFRRNGCSVTRTGDAAPDAGADLVVHKGDNKAVVLCRRWQAREVDATLVQELHSVMIAESADEAVLISCGEYTADARRFADGKPIRLVNGEVLAQMIRAVQERAKAEG